MIFRRFLTISGLLAALAPWSGAGIGAPKVPPADEAFLKAYDAFRAGDSQKLSRASAPLGRHVLAPYLEYWRLQLRLEDKSDADVRTFLLREAGSYVADRLRADWLKQLGKRADWQSFDQELPQLAQDDLELRCYAWLSRLARLPSCFSQSARRRSAT